VEFLGHHHEAPKLVQLHATRTRAGSGTAIIANDMFPENLSTPDIASVTGADHQHIVVQFMDNAPVTHSETVFVAAPHGFNVDGGPRLLGQLHETS